MIKTEEFSAKTAEEAIAKGLQALCLERDDVSVEILERGKGGFLGIGAVNAVVRLSFEAPDEAPAKPTKPAREKKAPAEDKPAAPKAPAQNKPQPPKERAVKRPAQGEQAEQTEAFLKGLLEHMGVQADIEISPREGGGLDVNLSGSGVGVAIGRRGETLDAIQHLTNYAVNRGNDKRSHINVDAENYRARREESLVHLAEKMAAKAMKYHRSMALEPMNSYERHIIHTALQEYEGVTTASTGAEPNRRVVISCVRSEKPERAPRERAPRAEKTEKALPAAEKAPAQEALYTATADAKSDYKEWC